MYPGTGTADGISGDHIIIAPSFYVTDEDVKLIVDRVSAAINTVFNNVSLEKER